MTSTDVNSPPQQPAIVATPPLSRWLSIRWTLPLMMLLPLVLGIGLTAALAFHSSRATAGKLIQAINAEVANRINQRLEEHLTQTDRLVEFLRLEMTVGERSINSPDKLRQFFWHATQHSSVDSVYYGSQQGNFLLVGRLPDGTFRYAYRDASTGNSRQTYILSPEGNVVENLGLQPYDPRQRPWYQEAQRQRRSVWTEVYLSSNPPNLTLTRATPLTVGDDFSGVIGVDLYFASLSQFLSNLNVSDHGSAFIINLAPNQRGELVATSRGESFTKDDTGQIVPLHALDAEDPVIRATAQYLDQTLLDQGVTESAEIHAQVSRVVPIEGERYWVTVHPVHRDTLHWLVVVSVPEADFAKEIYKNVRRTVLWGVAITGAVTLLSVGLSQWITRPIQRLSQVASDVKQNHYPADTLRLVTQRPDELGELAMLFGDMALVVISREQSLSEQVASLRAEVAQYGSLQGESRQKLLHLLQRAQEIRQAYTASSADPPP